MKNGLLLLAIPLLQACGTLAYTPAEHPLREGLIPTLSTSGPVSVTNGQPAKEEYIVYSYGGTKLASNLNAITDAMVQQTKGEIARYGRPAGAGAPKSIELKVNGMQSVYIAFFWKSTLDFQAKLGNGVVVAQSVPHTSGSVHQNLNGNIAESVMKLLNDAKVRDYLKR